MQVIQKSTNIDPSQLHKVCWNCFRGSPDSHGTVTIIGQESAKLLWLIFCKLDTEGKLKLHLQVYVYIASHVWYISYSCCGYECLFRTCLTLGLYLCEHVLNSTHKLSKLFNYTCMLCLLMLQLLGVFSNSNCLYL